MANVLEDSFTTNVIEAAHIVGDLIDSLRDALQSEYPDTTVFRLLRVYDQMISETVSGRLPLLAGLTRAMYATYPDATIYMVHRVYMQMMSGFDTRQCQMGMRGRERLG